MACVALMAMLLLTLLPSVGRLVSRPLNQLQGASAYALAARGAVEPAWGAMCTSRGLVYDPVVAAQEASGFELVPEGSDPPSPTPYQHPDCDYCTLSASAAVPAAMFVSSSALPASRTPCILRSQIPAWIYPLGLGSRGPPHTA